MNEIKGTFKELDDSVITINVKATETYKSLQQRIDKAIEELDDPFEDEDGDASWYEIAETYKNQIEIALKILKGE